MFSVDSDLILSSAQRLLIVLTKMLCFFINCTVKAIYYNGGQAQTIDKGDYGLIFLLYLELSNTHLL